MTPIHFAMTPYVSCPGSPLVILLPPAPSSSLLRDLSSPDNQDTFSGRNGIVMHLLRLYILVPEAIENTIFEKKISE